MTKLDTETNTLMAKIEEVIELPCNTRRLIYNHVSLRLLIVSNESYKTGLTEGQQQAEGKKLFRA